jgi:hypothetical protein
MLNSAIPWEFVDDSNNLITSHNRVLMLAEKGFYFEACATQATVIEAILFFSMLGVVLNESRPQYEDVAKGLSKLTLGGLIRRAEELSLLESEIITQLKNYKEKRNFLVHHHLVEAHDFDYKTLLSEDEAILAALYRPLRRRVYERLKAIGHKDVDKFKDEA